MPKILNFGQEKIIAPEKNVSVIDFGLEELKEGVSEIKWPILKVMEALEKGGAEVFLGDYILVLPSHPFLSAGIVLGFFALNKSAPLVAKTERTEEGLKIVKIADLGVILREVAVIREEILREYQRYLSQIDA